LGVHAPGIPKLTQHCPDFYNRFGAIHPKPEQLRDRESGFWRHIFFAGASGKYSSARLGLAPKQAFPATTNLNRAEPPNLLWTALSAGRVSNIRMLSSGDQAFPPRNLFGKQLSMKTLAPCT
jgi:hypothetical protein